MQLKTIQRCAIPKGVLNGGDSECEEDLRFYGIVGVQVK
jgi:hypothetical protein